MSEGPAAEERGDGGTVRIARCPKCRSVGLPSRTSCPSCGAATVADRVVGHARLETWTVIHVAPQGFTAPYVLAWAQLDAAELGVMGRLRDVAPASAATLRRGMPLLVDEEFVVGDDQVATVWMKVAPV